MSYAMISYSTKNQASADAMKAFLERNGIGTWMAPGDIPPGSRYAQVINRAIRTCSCVVLLLSEESQESPWVSSELERAKNYRKPIIPVQIDQVVLNDEFEFYLSTSHVIAVQRVDENSPACRKILASVQAMVSEPEATEMPTGKPATVLAPAPVPAPAPVHVPLSRQTPTVPASAEDHFELMDRLGAGMVGTVYRARDKQTDRVVTVKKYDARIANELACFYDGDVREVLTSLAHPNLCSVQEIVSGKAPYMVMEWLQGETLGSYMQFRVMTLQERVALFEEIASGLSELHRHGLYYGDLNPSNVMVVNGHAVLCDYSESNFFNRRPSQRTLVFEGFFDPERMTGQPMDARSDVFAAGMLLDWMTGKKIDRDAMINALLSGQQIYYSGYDITTPLEANIVRAIRAALRINKEDRPADMAEMLRILRQAE